MIRCRILTVSNDKDSGSGDSLLAMHQDTLLGLGIVSIRPALEASLNPVACIFKMLHDIDYRVVVNGN